MTLHVGDTAHVYGNFIVDGAGLTDPSALSIRVQSPSQRRSGTMTTYTYGEGTVITRLSTGKYRAAISITEAGTWRFTWRSPGPIGKGVQPGSFQVEPTVP